MSPEQRLAVIESKLDMLLSKLVSPEDLREAELEAQYAEALRQASVNPASIREFVQQNVDWVTEHSKRAA